MVNVLSIVIGGGNLFKIIAIETVIKITVKIIYEYKIQ